MVGDGGRWWAMVGDGGRWWAMVGDGGRWWAMVGDGGSAQTTYRDFRGLGFCGLNLLETGTVFWFA